VKKYLVIGNPIDHSLSPKLHNYWIKKNNINAIYEKKKINETEIKDVILDIKKEKINGINVTVPYKKKVIPFIDELSEEAKKTQSVNTIYKQNHKIIGHNTDISGFELALRKINYDAKNKIVFILGAGGVVSSIILSLKKIGASKIILSNRTINKAEDLKLIFPELEILKWGDFVNCDMVINATSLGLNKNDEIKINFDYISSDKFFYDVIYNPKETNFIKKAKQNGNPTENGKMMFIYQAHQAFLLWHKIIPKIDEETIKLID
jgi:shikimate dehydrogenase